MTGSAVASFRKSQHIKIRLFLYRSRSHFEQVVMAALTIHSRFVDVRRMAENNPDDGFVVMDISTSVVSQDRHSASNQENQS